MVDHCKLIESWESLNCQLANDRLRLHHVFMFFGRTRFSGFCGFMFFSSQSEYALWSGDLCCVMKSMISHRLCSQNKSQEYAPRVMIKRFQNKYMQNSYIYRGIGLSYPHKSPQYIQVDVNKNDSTNPTPDSTRSFFGVVCGLAPVTRTKQDAERVCSNLTKQ